MNIELKSKILKESITVEDLLSNILMTMLDIEEPDNKSLGYRGTALSFKSKVDLLFDIQKIDKTLYSDLIMFMEIRNQFIHNIDADSFETVVDRIDKRKKLLAFYKEELKSFDYEADEEHKLEISFTSLCYSILTRLIDVKRLILKEKMESLKVRIDIIQKEQAIEIQEIMLKALSDSIDDAVDLFNIAFDKSEFGRQLSKEGELMKKFKSALFGFLDKRLTEAVNNRKKN